MHCRADFEAEFSGVLGGGDKKNKSLPVYYEGFLNAKLIRLMSMECCFLNLVLKKKIV